MEKKIQKIVLSILLLILTLNANAQTSTVTFETGNTKGAKSFISNGFPFEIGYAWEIENIPNLGFNRSAWYIDNYGANCVGLEDTVGSIKSANGTIFYLNEVWLFGSTNCGDNFGIDSAEVIWVKENNIVHSKKYLVRTAFVPGHNTGFWRINFDADGNSCIAADEIKFRVTGALNYLALDQMKWSTQMTPSSLASVVGDKNNTCPSETVVLSPEDIIIGSGATLRWFDGGNGSGNNLGTTATLSVSPNVTTTYYARLAGICNTVERSIEVAVTKNLSIINSLSASDNNICPESSVILLVDGSSGAGASPTWYDAPRGNGNLLGASPILTVSPSNTRKYYYYLEGDCNIVEDSIEIIVDQEYSSIGNITSSGNDTCSYSTLTLNANDVIIGAGAELRWYDAQNNLIASVDNPITVTPSTSTTYTAKIENNCNSTSASININIFATNTDVTKDATTLVVSTTSGASYSWLDCNDDYNALGSMFNVFTASDNGNYAVEVTNGFCKDTSTCYEINEIISFLESPYDELTISTYPNPVIDKLTIETSTKLNYAQLSIYSTLGTQIHSQTITGNSTSIEVNDLNKGLYILTIEENSKKLTTKFIKE